MCKFLNIKGTILPLTEEKVDLVGDGYKGNEFFGEEDVSLNVHSIKKLRYDHDVKIRDEVLEKIKAADLIIMSSGSLYTSILPHLIVNEVKDAIYECPAPIMYVSNLVTQPGETDGYAVSDHLKVLNEYLEKRKVDIVLANNAPIEETIAKKYKSLEQKELVQLDKEKVESMGTRIIQDKVYVIDSGTIRHNALKTAYLIFSYLMEGE